MGKIKHFDTVVSPLNNSTVTDLKAELNKHNDTTRLLDFVQNTSLTSSCYDQNCASDKIIHLSACTKSSHGPSVLVLGSYSQYCEKEKFTYKPV